MSDSHPQAPLNIAGKLTRLFIESKITGWAHRKDEFAMG